MADEGLIADEALIAAVQRRQALYNKDNSEYSNRVFIRRQWEEIAMELETDAETARKRWTRLRDYFQRNHKNIMTYFKSGSPGGKIRKWYLYDALSFLIPFLMDRPATSSIGPQDTEEADFMESSCMPSYPFSYNFADIKLGQDSQEICYTREQQHYNQQPQQQQRPQQRKVASNVLTNRGKKRKFPREQVLSSSMLNMEMMKTMKELRECVDKSSRPEKVQDQDELYCLSLVPKMKALDTITKLECQAELNIVLVKHLKAMERKNMQAISPSPPLPNCQASVVYQTNTVNPNPVSTSASNAQPVDPPAFTTPSDQYFTNIGQSTCAAMEGVLSPRESGRFITENSRDVFLVEEGVRKLADSLSHMVKRGSLDVTMWRRHELNPQTMDDVAVDWVFVSAVLNFSFWSENENEKYMVRYKGQEHTGYWSLCAAMNRALDEGFPITTPSFYASVNIETMKKIFRSDSDFDIPMLEERHWVLNEAGKVLTEKFHGSFANVIKEANQSAQKLISLVLNNFSSFQDVAEFCGKKVGLYKRVQILVGDVWGCCEGRGLGHFMDIETVTMFADYRIPQALVYFGAMKYSDSLMDKLRKGVLLMSGEREEVEIRGVCLWACELIRDEIMAQLRQDPDTQDKKLSINAILIDHYLWDKRREIADQMKDIPFHHCRGIYY